MSQNDDLMTAAMAVLTHRNGELPVAGWLADNDASRRDLEALQKAVNAHLRGEAAQGEQQAVAGYVYPEHLKLNGPDWGPAALYHEKHHRTIPLYTHPQPTAVADMPPKGKPSVGCQCPSCGEEFAASAAPAPVAGDDVGLHVLTGVFDKHGEELRAGDRIVIRIEGEHTKPEYWNPEYVIAWVAPRFTLRHVGGGLDSDTARWYFGLGTDQGYKMLELLDRPAALAQGDAA